MASHHRIVAVHAACMAAGICIGVLFPACETETAPSYSTQLLQPEPGTTRGLKPTLLWRIVNYTPGESYHVLVRTDVAENPLDDYYGHEFDTGWHSGQMQQATIVLPEDRYANARVWWALRVWDSHGTEYECQEKTWWFHCADDFRDSDVAVLP